MQNSKSKTIPIYTISFCHSVTGAVPYLIYRTARYISTAAKNGKKQNSTGLALNAATKSSFTDERIILVMPQPGQ